jgi:hypothetical protein
MSSRVSVVAFVVLILAASASPQNRPLPPPAPEPSKPRTDEPGQGRREPDVSIPEEMRTRLLIERAEDEHRKLLDDVRQLGDLSTELSKTYQERNRFGPEDMKKLGSIEKLAKRVLSKALGKEEKAVLPVRLSIAEAIDQLDSAAQKIRKVFDTETRFVVSAAVISNSNEVISLAERIRQLQKHED